MWDQIIKRHISRECVLAGRMMASIKYFAHDFKNNIVHRVTRSSGPDANAAHRQMTHLILNIPVPQPPEDMLIAPPPSRFPYVTCVNPTTPMNCPNLSSSREGGSFKQPLRGFHLPPLSYEWLPVQFNAQSTMPQELIPYAACLNRCHDVTVEITPPPLKAGDITSPTSGPLTAM